MFSRSTVPTRRRKGQRSSVRARAAVVLCGLAVLCAPSAASATSRPVVIPPFGKVYNGLAVAWWQYAVSRPAATNPLRDTTGEHCADGQSGPVFFLVGTQGSDPVERTCTVRGLRALFLPIINAVDVHTPAGDFPDENFTPELVYQEFLALTNGSGDLSASGLHASVDGREIANLNPPNTPYRACALPVRGCFPAAFSFTLPADNVFDFAHEPAGRYFPALQDGYYLLLAPLAPGRHTIRFGGDAFFNGDFSQDITYHLNIVR
jgi:hypothetical protein